MAARARIVDGPYPADVGRGTLMDFGGVYYGDHQIDYVMARRTDAEVASLASLRHLAARRARAAKRRPYRHRDYIYRMSIAVTRDDSGIFHREIDEEELSFRAENQFSRIPEDPIVSIEEGEVRVDLIVWSEDRPDAEEAEARLRPFLERSEATAELGARPEDEWYGRGYCLDVRIRRNFPRGATLGEAWRLGEDAKTLLGIRDDDGVPRSLAIDLIRSGHWGVFKGQAESDWLEAKGAPYAKANARLGENWRYELAKDVAAFANSPDGGIIVIGMTTQDGGDGDVITGFKEFDLKQVTATVYGNHVARCVFPRVEGFEVVRAPGGRDRRRGIVALVIPPQNPSNLPFLVRGAIRDGAVLGNHVLWPVRRGDQTALLDVDGIHSRLRLGDQAIQG